MQKVERSEDSEHDSLWTMNESLPGPNRSEGYVCLTMDNLRLTENRDGQSGGGLFPHSGYW